MNQIKIHPDNFARINALGSALTQLLTLPASSHSMARPLTRIEVEFDPHNKEQLTVRWHMENAPTQQFSLVKKEEVEDAADETNHQ